MFQNVKQIKRRGKAEKDIHIHNHIQLIYNYGIYSMDPSTAAEYLQENFL